MFGDRNRYFLEENHESDNAIHDKVPTISGYQEENPMEGNQRMSKKRRMTSESPSNPKSSSVFMPKPVQKHFRTERLVAASENVKPCATRRHKSAKVVKLDLKNDVELSPVEDTGGELSDIAEVTNYNPIIDSTPETYINCLRSEVLSLTEKVAICELRMAKMKNEHETSQKHVAELSLLDEEHAEISNLFERLVKLLGNDRPRASLLFLNFKNLIITYASDHSSDIATKFTSILNEILFG